MSVFGLWARRHNRWLLGILAVMVAVELGLFYWAMVRYPSGDLEQIMTDSCISLAAGAAFMVLSGVQLVMGREAWANAVNCFLERHGFDERVDHRSHAARGLDERPTVHEGVTARALEKKGIISDRCELNQQIKRDNVLLRELKAHVKKLMQAVKNTVPALAEAMESVREKMIIFKYQLSYILTGKRRLEKSLETVLIPLILKTQSRSDNNYSDRLAVGI